MSLCPEAAIRAAMDDAEFWEHVFNSGPHYEPDDYDPDHEALDVDLAATPCPECGAVGACAWDIDGRPLIHATTGDDT